MMKLFTIYLVLCSVFILGNGCESTNEPDEPEGFKGYIYYSNNDGMSRIRLSDDMVEELFTNAFQPDITDDGRIIAVESAPKERIIITNVSDANRQTILESEPSFSQMFKYMFDKPRISYNQTYIAYEGDKVHNPITYVINSKNGELVATIGDFDSRQPMISPSWSSDGSLYVQGIPSMNNGIYRISSDFKQMNRIDPNLSNVSEPSVSPDGMKIAFIREGKVWTMGPDGSNATLLNSEKSNFTMPTWSPDSKYLAVTSSGIIHIIDFDKLTITKLSNGYSNAGNQMCWRY
jgi:Tol biopolymer transport system component